jgi:SAM-dependent methyltransferase
MSWQEYYRYPAVTFGEQSFAYKSALNAIAEKDIKVLDRNSRKNIVLGGFHSSQTVTEFKELCKELFPNDHEYYLLDMNRHPLSTIDSKTYPNRIQARLEELPFAPKSIDLMFLDYTFVFMDNLQIKKFFDNAHKVLSPSGLILATYNDPGKVGLWNMFQKKFLDRHHAPVPMSYHKQEKLCQLAKPLRPVFNTEFKTTLKYTSASSLTVFAQPDSTIPKNQTIFKSTLTQQQP